MFENKIIIKFMLISFANKCRKGMKFGVFHLIEYFRNVLKVLNIIFKFLKVILLIFNWN